MEPAVRRLVADHLGVGLEVLVSNVSLREDLAADSLDLVDLAMRIEAEFAIAVPDRVLDRVRTYGDLVKTTGRLVRSRCDEEARGAKPPSSPVQWRAAGGPVKRVGMADRRRDRRPADPAKSGIALRSTRAALGRHIEDPIDGQR